jgi:hypothetical protein
MPAITNILFNALKHHRGFIHEQIALATPATLPELLKKLGNSQMDIYYGALGMKELMAEVVTHVPVENEAEYLAWLGDYREVTLSDGSRWILLAGNVPGQYIHLHPGRYSPHSMRVKATILKTAIACMVCFPGVERPVLAQVNEMRRRLLALSPVRDLEQCQHLWKVMGMFL